MSDLPTYDEANNPSMQGGMAPSEPYPPPGSYSNDQPSYPSMNTGHQTSQPQYPPAQYQDAYPTKGDYPDPSTNPPPAVVNPTTTAPSGQVLVTQPQQPQTTIIVANQPYGNQMYRGFPVDMKCHYCQEQMTTVINYTTGGMTWLLCGVIAFVGCFCGCCLVPFCIDGCKDIQHNCSKCGRVVGTYRKL